MLYLAIRSLRKATGKGRQGRLSLRWDEAAHPRGQSQNPGQFAPKGGQQGPAATATAPKPATNGNSNGQGREPVGELAAKLGRKQGAPSPHKPDRLTFGSEDLEFSDVDKAAAPYTWRVKQVARTIGNIFEPMALWALRDDQLEALRREVRRNDDEVGMMLVDVHRNVRKGFSRRQREDTRQTVFAMYREALGRQHPDDDGPVRKSLGAVTLEEAFAAPVRATGARRLLVAVGGWLAKAAGQLSLFDESKVEQHRAETEAGKLRASLAQRIREAGEAPTGSNQPEGERISDTQNIYGGGDWFVVGDDFIWYVQNNGMDGDNWSRNNVQTGGAGAIGWRVPYDEDLAQEIRSTIAPVRKSAPAAGRSYST